MSAATTGAGSPSKRKPTKAFTTSTAHMLDKENRGSPLKDVSRQSQNVREVVSRFPSTPGKISITDLLLNPEDMPLPTATPQEQITWTHQPGLLDTPSSSVRTTQKTASQRGMKRSASSSPGSSQNRKSKHFKTGSGQGYIVRRHQQSPNQDDPAAVLWNAYAEKRGGEPVLPPLPPLDLSPRAKEAFRRVASCGNEWPTSSSKRRKLSKKDPHSTTKQIFASKRKQLLRPDLSKQNRVSILLESVQQNLEAKRHQQLERAPSSSSPLPERVDPDRPTEHKTKPVDAQHSPSPRKAVQHTGRSLTGSPLKHVSPSKSSDYGDLEDFDDHDLEDIEQALTQSQLQIPHPTVRCPAKETSTLHQAFITETALSPTRPRPNKPPDLFKHVAKPPPILQKAVTAPLLQRNDLDEFDEFDDFDDDDGELTAELDQLAQNIESRPKPASNLSVGRPPAQAIPSFDGIHEDSWDDLDEDDMQALSAATGSAMQQIDDHRIIKRYLILEVIQAYYDDHNNRRKPQKILKLKDDDSRNKLNLLLRQSWYDTRCVKNSYVHVIGTVNQPGQCIVDDTQNMVIIHPDHLISSTVVGDAITCLRRAVLQDRIKATNPPERPQVYGHILHEVFGEAFKLNKWDDETFHQILARVLPNYLESLYEINVQVSDATNHLMSKAQLMRSWADIFISADLKSGALLRGRNDTTVPAVITKLLEVEEHVWSPQYGLKGNIDATVQARILLPSTDRPRNLVVPFELKTGSKDSVDAHRAQTALYTLLLSDRYDIEITNGILCYVETSKTFRIEGVRNEIRQMLQWRNMLASYVHNKLELPPMAQREHMCKSCYAQLSCFTYHKLVEHGDGKTSGLKEIFDGVVGHLKPQHQAFFKHWDDLLTKEERDMMKFKRELWTMLSGEREKVGRCFGQVILEPNSAIENENGSKINRFTYSFVRQDAKITSSFTESQITVGEPIVISDERGHFALANGYVTRIRPKRVTVAVDRRLGLRERCEDFDAITNQDFVGTMEVKIHDRSATPIADEEPKLYRIDKDEFSNGMATIRNNLIRIMEKDLFKARELRELVVDLRPPTWKSTSTAYSIAGPASQAQINVDQQAAIEKVLSAKDYALVLGMPGTGKTTTIAHIIRALVSQGKSVLLASYTHTAVDNILLKIKDDKIPILRLGSVGKVHPDIANFATLSGIPCKTMPELERSWQHSKVVATTCLGINHGIFNHRIFDYCIVDEASQITLPVCLGPIRLSHTFVLVGDHYQLPPLVQNKEAQEGGLDISLFKLLSDRHPQAVVSLEHQYRMAADIMLLSNKLIYGGRLKCGTSTVASRTLQVPFCDTAMEAHHRHSSISETQGTAQPVQYCYNPTKQACFLQQVLRPANRVLFFDTDSVSHPGRATELVTGSRITNPTEATLTAQMLTILIRSGVPAKSIGIITFYRSQLSLLRDYVKAVAGTSAASEVEMHTADKYQGRDKEVILLSCVRSNDSSHVGDLLRDWRRVNVALTRARSKLMIVGSLKTLQNSGVEVLQGLVKLVRGQSWIIDLPWNATEGHIFQSVTGCITQSQVDASAKLSKTSAQKKVTPIANPRQVLAELDGNRIMSNFKDFALDSVTTRSASRKNTRLPAYKAPKKIVHGSDMAKSKMKTEPKEQGRIDSQVQMLDLASDERSIGFEGYENKSAKLEAVAILKSGKSQDITAFGSDEFYGGDDDILTDF